MGVFIRVDAVYINSGQRFFADEIILVHANQGKGSSDGHGKAIRAAAIHRNAIIKYRLLVVPCANLLVSIIGNHAAIAVEGESITGKL